MARPRKDAEPVPAGVTVSAKVSPELASFLDDKRFELRRENKADLVREAVHFWAAANGFQSVDFG